MNLKGLLEFYRENGILILIEDKWLALRRKIRAWYFSRQFAASGLRMGEDYYLRGISHIKMGNNFTAGKSLWLEAVTWHNGHTYTPQIIIKNNVAVNDYVHIAATNYVEIGNHVLMGSKIYISDHNHGMYGGEKQATPEEPPNLRYVTNHQKVIIEDNVWIGEMVAILPGVTVGRGSIIGALSVITKDIPPYSIAVGNPAKVIKQFNHATQQWVTKTTIEEK